MWNSSYKLFYFNLGLNFTFFTQSKLQTDPPVDFLLYNRINKIHTLKYLRSTTLGSKVSKEALVYKHKQNVFRIHVWG